MNTIDDGMPLLVCDASDETSVRWVLDDPPPGVPPVFTVPTHVWGDAAVPQEGCAYRAPYRDGKWVWSEMVEDQEATSALLAEVEAQRAEWAARRGEDVTDLPPIAPGESTRDDAMTLPPIPPHDPDDDPQLEGGS